MATVVFKFPQSSHWLSYHPTNHPLLQRSSNGFSTRGRRAQRTLLEGFEDLLSGAVGPPEAQQWVKEFYKKIEGEIFTERFVNRSFFRRYLRGRLCALHCEVHLTNWTIDARICEFMQDGETPQQVATRLANRQAYLQAVNDLQDLWRRFYAEGHKWAVADVAKATGFALVRARRQRDQCRSLQAQPPALRINVATLNNAAQAEQAKLLPIDVRPQAQRLAYWRDSFSRDMLASHLESSRHVVDVRRLTLDAEPENPPVAGQGRIPPYSSMWSNHWAVACDVVSRLVTGLQEAYRREFLLADPRIRLNAERSWQDFSRGVCESPATS
ncbi:hypothetical protein BKA63DRAFT_570504 [Paraphoma chrysanthemicola]|nr:hypothetical protein BKA63DRAFT_570504 [Paraphoma chrysanthemicola]